MLQRHALLRHLRPELIGQFLGQRGRPAFFRNIRYVPSKMRVNESGNFPEAGGKRDQQDGAEPSL